MKDYLEDLKEKCRLYTIPQPGKSEVENDDEGKIVNVKKGEPLYFEGDFDLSREDLLLIMRFFLKGESRMSSILEHTLYPDYGGWKKRPAIDVLHIIHNQALTYFGDKEIENPAYSKAEIERKQLEHERFIAEQNRQLELRKKPWWRFWK